MTPEAFRNAGPRPDVFVAKVTVKYGGRHVVPVEELQRPGNAGDGADRLKPEPLNSILKHHRDDRIVLNNENAVASCWVIHKAGRPRDIPASLYDFNRLLHLGFLL